MSEPIKFSEKDCSSSQHAEGDLKGGDVRGSKKIKDQEKKEGVGGVGEGDVLPVRKTEQRDETKYPGVIEALVCQS